MVPLAAAKLLNEVGPINQVFEAIVLPLDSPSGPIPKPQTAGGLANAGSAKDGQPPRRRLALEGASPFAATGNHLLKLRVAERLYAEPLSEPWTCNRLALGR